MSLGAPEIEAATMDAIVGETARASRHALPIGAPCPNCATPLAGPWCHACGQKGEEYHRNIWHLIAEAFEGLTHFDSRLWNTLPRIIFRPGKLTSEYLEGHRASQIPPFRLFLIVLLLVFFAGGLSMEQTNTKFRVADPNDPVVSKNMTPQEKAQYAKGWADVKRALSMSDADYQKAAGAAAQPASAKDKTAVGVDIVGDPKRTAWVKERLRHAIDNPDSFFFAMESWGHRFAILMLPIAALMLSVLFAFRKGVYLFDHVIFAMHSLSFVGILLTTLFLVAIAWSGVWWLLWALPVHLFVHMRGTYRTSVVGTLARMSLLFLGTTIVVVFLISGLVFVGLATAH